MARFIAEAGDLPDRCDHRRLEQHRLAQHAKPSRSPKFSTSSVVGTVGCRNRDFLTFSVCSVAQWCIHLFRCATNVARCPTDTYPVVAHLITPAQYQPAATHRPSP